MKVKMKLDVASIKSWLLAHGEKVGLGIVGVMFLLFVYSALQLGALDAAFEPDKLKQLAGAVQSHVGNSTWDANREKIQVVNYAERAKVKEIPVGSYPLAYPWNPRVTDPKAKRAQPEVLPVEDLRVAAGMDIFSVKATKPTSTTGAASGESDGQLQARAWAVVTGLVPLARQNQVYAETFAEALDFAPARDVPKYLKPLLERAVVDPANPAQLTWEPVASAAVVTDGRTSSSGEIISTKYIDPSLTEPLEVLVGSQWGESVGHPKIPLLADSVASPTGTTTAGAGSTSTTAGPTSATTGEPQIEYLLLRAFDYSVQPGKKYRYRVSLVVDNPNANSPPQVLQDPETAKATTLASAVTEPTPVVTIPDGHDVLAGTVDPGSRYTEPTAKILVTAIDVRSGLKAATEIDAHRGTLANTAPQEVQVAHPLEKKIVSLTLPFRSNMLVLDIYGGANLPGRRRDEPLTKPAEILLLDSAGNMTVRSELDDFAQYQDSIVREPAAKPDTKALEDPKTRPGVKKTGPGIQSR